MQENKQVKSLIKQNILQYLSYKGVSEYTYYKESDTTRGILGQNNGISEDNISRFLDYAPDVSYEWLLTGKGEMLKPTLSTKSKDVELTPIHQLRYFEPKKESQFIPLYDFKASAGLRELFDNGNNKAIDSILIPNAPKCDGAIRIIGDSMYPMLKTGDIIIYKEVTPSFENIIYGEMYLISYSIDYDYYVVVKYIRRSEQGEPYVTLASENPKHSDKDIDFRRVNALALVKASVNVSTME